MTAARDRAVAAVDALLAGGAAVVVARIEGSTAEAKGGLGALIASGEEAVPSCRRTKIVRIGAASELAVRGRLAPAAARRIVVRTDRVGRSS